MSFSISWVSALIVLLLGAGIAALVFHPWTHDEPETIISNTVNYDDSAVSILRDSLRALRNELALQPRVVVIHDTVTGEPDTVRFAPVGSWTDTHEQPFEMCADTDTVRLVVLAEHDVRVWSDSLGVLYHDGETRLQVRDLVVRQYVTKPAQKVPWFGLFALLGADTAFDGTGDAQLGVGVRIKRKLGLALIGNTAGRAGLQLELEL